MEIVGMRRCVFIRWSGWPRKIEWGGLTEVVVWWIDQWMNLGWIGGGIGIDDGLKWSVVRRCEGVEKNISIWI